MNSFIDQKMSRLDEVLVIDLYTLKTVNLELRVSPGASYEYIWQIENLDINQEIRDKIKKNEFPTIIGSMGYESDEFIVQFYIKDENPVEENQSEPSTSNPDVIPISMKQGTPNAVSTHLRPLIG
jgi:hypothetical protein